MRRRTCRPTEHAWALHLTRTRVVTLVALLASGTACRDRTGSATRDSSSSASSVAANGSAGAVPANAAQARDSTALVDTVTAVIARHHMLGIPAACVTLERTGMAGSQVTFTVRERHGDGCGGDTTTAPRLFAIGIDTLSWAIVSDAGSTDGTMRPVKPTPP